jgi:hypothetical protein
LSSFVVFCRLLSSFVVFCRLLPTFTGFYRFCRLLPDFAEFCRYLLLTGGKGAKSQKVMPTPAVKTRWHKGPAKTPAKEASKRGQQKTAGMPAASCFLWLVPGPGMGWNRPPRVPAGRRRPGVKSHAKAKTYPAWSRTLPLPWCIAPGPAFLLACFPAFPRSRRTPLSRVHALFLRLLCVFSASSLRFACACERVKRYI